MGPRTACKGADPYGLNEEAPAENRRPCPMCGEMILVNAVKCRFCGEVFDDDLKGVETKKQKKKKKKSRSHDPADEDMSTGDWVVAIFCSGIGCLAGLIWMIQGKPKGGKMLGVSIAMVIVWNVIGTIIQMANKPGGP